VILSIGSQKGLFVAESAANRRDFTLRGPFGSGVAVYSALIETRGAPAVWRSENGGAAWTRLNKGMPQKESFFTVQRDAMDIDELKSPALYFGTTTGQLWIGRDGGDSWDRLFDSLPPIHCVKAAVV